MASLASSWYTELDFDSYVLDLLLLGWCGTAVIVYMSVKSIRSALGPVARQPALDRGPREPLDSGLATMAELAKKGESCQWFNTAMSWLYLHYYNTPHYLDQWVQSLNLQLTKLGGPVQNKVEKVQPASLPPRITNITCQTPSDGSVILLTKVESQDLLLSMFASQQTSDGVQLTNCVAHVLKLNGVLRLKFYREKKDVKLKVIFDSRPEIKVEVTPSNPYQDPSTLADLGVVERNVRNALGLAETTSTITKLLMPGDLSTVPHPHADVDDDEETGSAPSWKPGEIRRFTAQRAQNKVAQVTSFTQKMQQQSQGPPPTIQEVNPQNVPQDISQGGGAAQKKVTVQPLPQASEATAKAPLAGSGGL